MITVIVVGSVVALVMVGVMVDMVKGGDYDVAVLVMVLVMVLAILVLVKLLVMITSSAYLTINHQTANRVALSSYTIPKLSEKDAHALRHIDGETYVG